MSDRPKPGRQTLALTLKPEDVERIRRHVAVAAERVGINPARAVSWFVLRLVRQYEENGAKFDD